LWTVPGSDVFLARPGCCTSIDRDLRDPAAAEEEEAAGIESRLMRPNALTRGAEPWRRRGSDEAESCAEAAAATAAEEEDVGETGEAGEGAVARWGEDVVGAMGLGGGFLEKKLVAECILGDDGRLARLRSEYGRTQATVVLQGDGYTNGAWKRTVGRRERQFQQRGLGAVQAMTAVMDGWGNVCVCCTDRFVSADSGGG
jgi:hypothetical protein